jgi:SAP domain
VSEKPEELGEQMRLDGPSAAAGPSGGEARGSRESGSTGSRSTGSRSGGRGGIRSDNKKVYQSRTVAELKLELKSRGLRQTGRKDDLINRLVEHDRTRGTRRGG